MSYNNTKVMFAGHHTYLLSLSEESQTINIYNALQNFVNVVILN